MYKSHWFDIILYIGLVQGLFLTFLLWKKKPDNQNAVFYLSILVGTVSFLILGRVNYQVKWFKEFAEIILLPDVILFLIGPFLWLFTRSLLRMPIPNKAQRQLHFIPAYIHIFVFNTIAGFTIGGYSTFFTSADLYRMFNFIELASISSLLTYLYLSYKCYKSYKTDFHQEFSTPMTGRFLMQFFAFVLLLVGCWITAYIYNYFISPPDYNPYSIIWILLTFSIFYLAYMVLVHPEILKLSKITEPMVWDNKIEDISFEKEKGLIENYMSSHKPYLDPEIKIGDLADQLQMPKHELSKIINKGFGMNFFDFINGYRIHEFIQLKKMEANSQPNILQLAFAAGFNSKSAFNRAFKKITGHTPSQLTRLQDFSMQQTSS